MKYAPWLFLLVLAGRPVAAALPEGHSADGWYSWRAAAVAGATAWCCLDRSRGGAGCNLDGRDGYTDCGGSAPEAPEGAFVRLYAKIESGDVARLRMLDPGCAVHAATPITDLGTVDAGESFGWLRGLVRDDSRVAGDALAAIAMHRGDEPLRFLVDSATAGASRELREDAIFWLGELRIAEGAPVIERLMFADRDADIRSHAAFVLAQSGADGSDDAIMKAVAGDPDREVREEAVFALSQLPGERAVDALLDVVGNRRLDREVRKAALFWLVQSGSDRAFATVERLLAGDGSGR